jgi:hypothetical protein
MAQRFPNRFVKLLMRVMQPASSPPDVVAAVLVAAFAAFLFLIWATTS